MMDYSISLICGFPGVGKSYLANLRGWHDSDSSTFSKGSKWPANYISHLRGLRGTVMASTHMEVRDALYAARIPFILCYPSRECMTEYDVRYENRGSSLNFRTLIATNWNRWIEELENDIRAQLHVVLKPGQYMSDIDWEVTTEFLSVK